MTRAEPASASRRSLRTRVFYLARRAWQMEIGIWQSLWRFLTGRRRVPAGARAFGYIGPVQTVLVVFIVLSAVEIPIIDLIVHPWPWVRIPLLAAGIWGVTWMLGLLLGYITRPHSVGPAGISIRSGPEIDIVVPWADVYSVEIRRDHEEKGQKVAPAEDGAGDVLKLWMQDETNLAVRFERPILVRMPTGVVTVIESRFWADDPRGFLAEAGRYL